MRQVLEAVGGSFVRTKARRLSRRFLQLARNGRQSQFEVLRRLLRLNSGSRFQAAYGLSGRTSVEAFRRQTPITNYDAIASYVDALKSGDASALCGSRNPLRMFALSSGTTGDTKYIPITRRFIEDYRRGWTVWGINVFDDHPGLNRLRILQLASDHDRFRTAGGVPCGNISGLVQTMQSRFLRFKYTLPAALLQITDPAAKSYALLRIAIADPQVGLIVTANPSTLVHLAREMDQFQESLLRDIHDGTLSVGDAVHPVIRQKLSHHVRRPDPVRAQQLSRTAARCGRLLPRDVWPSLSVLGVWTGGSARAYLPAVYEAYGNVAIRDHGLSASEGRMTIPFADSSSSGVLDVGAHFFEFIPETEIDEPQPQTLLAHELEVGENYYILLTTASGLYRYDIRDVVCCTGYVGTTPTLEFLHKGAHIANVTGEKVTESQVVAAVRAATYRLSLSLSYYTVAPVWGEPPLYRILLESREVPGLGDAARLASLVDIELQQLNCEYADKRRTGRLGRLTATMLPNGAWMAMIRRRQSQPGGSLEQYKHPCLKPDLDYAQELVRASRAALKVA
ncbi:MAG: GH3 auxin-responsive promoter family protein [Planctomycetaceae bacterium]|nr:GH3 auxin-responsive promoter family protein [Planctomycetaceae bacterium]